MVYLAKFFPFSPRKIAVWDECRLNSRYIFVSDCQYYQNITEIRITVVVAVLIVIGLFSNSNSISTQLSLERLVCVVRIT